jgi:hypothetical protein
MVVHEMDFIIFCSLDFSSMAAPRRFTRSMSRAIAEENRILSEANEYLSARNTDLKNEVEFLRGALDGARTGRDIMEARANEHVISLQICQDSLRASMVELKAANERIKALEAGQAVYTGPPGFESRL